MPELNLNVEVLLVDERTLTFEQAAAWAKARQLFEETFRKTDKERRTAGSDDTDYSIKEVGASEVSD